MFLLLSTLYNHMHIMCIHDVFVRRGVKKFYQEEGQVSIITSLIELYQLPYLIHINLPMIVLGLE